MNLLKRLRPITVGLVAAGVLLGGTACSRVQDFQTIQSYTPAEGVPMVIERQPTADEVERQVNPIPIRVSNLMIVATETGTGYISGNVVSPIDTTLQSIEGQALDAAGSPVGPITVTGGATQVGADRSLILASPDSAQAQEAATASPAPKADYATYEVTSDAMEAGLLAELTVTFADGTATVQVPVVDGDKAPYQGETQEPTPIEVENEK